MDNKDILEHYGVKGMRWGVRRKRPSSSDYTETKGLRRRNPKELSNDELAKITKRLNLEKNYSRLSPTTTASGKSATAKILSSAGKATLTAGATAGFTLAGKAVINYAKNNKKVRKVAVKTVQNLRRAAR